MTMKHICTDKETMYMCMYTKEETCCLAEKKGHGRYTHPPTYGHYVNCVLGRRNNTKKTNQKSKMKPTPLCCLLYIWYI